jgi:hypothetical protein
LPKTWKSLQEHGDQVNCNVWWNTWRKMHGGQHVFLIPMYFIKNWNDFFNIYIGAFIIMNLSFLCFHIVLLQISKELSIGGIF